MKLNLWTEQVVFKTLKQLYTIGRSSDLLRFLDQALVGKYEARSQFFSKIRPEYKLVYESNISNPRGNARGTTSIDSACPDSKTTADPSIKN